MPSQPRWSALLAAAVALGCGAAAASEIELQARQFALDAAATAGARKSRSALTHRLRPAPCERVEPYVPAGTRLWGRSRIGLALRAGPYAERVPPVTVKVYGRALAAAAALPAGAVLTSADLQTAEVDLAAGTLPLMTPASALGRALARPLAAGQPLRAADLRARQWFAAGDTVQIDAIGTGFRISGEGQALGPGLEGQPARVRIAGGRVVTGQPVAERRMELRL
jgi:flagella basal body P-ring formation protein FlgA